MAAVYSASDYSKMLKDFVEMGVVWGYPGDDMSRYLVQTMENPAMKVLALRNEVMGRVFYDCMMRFVNLNLNRSKLAYNRSQSEKDLCGEAADWTSKRQKDGWQGLVEMIKQKNPDSFDADFYAKSFQQDGDTINQQTWKQMIMDWDNAINQKIMKASREKLEDDMNHAMKITENNMKGVEDYIGKTGIGNKEFLQAWNMMEGVWNEILIKDFINTVKIQRRYPVIEEIALRMGRYPDEKGTDTIMVGNGSANALRHSQKSDITGVTSGRNIADAFPMEIAMCGDDDMDELFLRKYVTNSLQIIDSRSEILSPAKKIRPIKAKRKGPMIICLDTSGSMAGPPMKVAQSLLLRLLDIAEQENRDCYLILFSISIVTFNLVKDRMKVFDYLNSVFTGGTDSTKMMEESFRLLNSDTEYSYGDVLWITDFRIPVPSVRLLAEQREHMRAGTCFYGLQIGIAKHEWERYFTRFYHEGWVAPRKY